MSQKSTGVQTIVCVDDDTLMLQSLREQLLRGLGKSCDIELASSGEEALQLLADLAAEGVDVPLLISDQNMPGMRGAELLARAHERDPAMIKILLTGQADVDAVSYAVNQANLYRLLTKTWQESDLVLTVKEALRRVNQERELARQTATVNLSHRRLEQSMELLRATMDATLDGLLVLDRQGEPVQINRQLAELWAIPEALARPDAGQALLAHLRSRLKDGVAILLDPLGGPDAPTVLALSDGRAIEYQCRAHRLHGEQVGTVYSFRDVTERQRSAALIHHQALYDRLSGLPNRYQFDDRLAQAIARARVTQGSLAVLFVDLDHFKRINDSLGHDVGDELLKCVAERLACCLREGDMIARWGGDEFTVLLPSLQTPDEPAVVARRILASLGSPMQLGERALQVSASIGMATYPADGQDGQSLLKNADLALYRVKAEGRNGFQRFAECPRASAGGHSGLTLETELRGALERGELLLHYQPQVDARTGLITDVEALLRWHHPQFGWIGPDTFVPIAEQTGLIVPIGEWVLRTACHQAADWHAQGFGEMRVAVNLSAVQFERCRLEEVVAQALADSGLAPTHLELEITEAIALRNMASTVKTLLALQASGVSIALDDFGCGYASLSYLRQLPCQTLKIDRSFIRELASGSKDAAIISALVALGAGLGLRVVAEGVETVAVKELLQRLGCRTMQGYLFSRPVDAQALTALLRGQRPRPRQPQPAEWIADTV